MRKIYERTWKIGELASMFDINVQLLRHYDKEGLLVPAIRNNETKWRTYKYDQIYPLGMIRFLRQLNCSLDDIGSFMPTRNSENTERYLKHCIRAERTRYEKFLKMESVLNDRFSLINREMKYATADQIYVYSEEEIYYIEIGGIEDIFVDELFYLYPTLVFYEGDERRFAIWIPGESTPEFEKYEDKFRVLKHDEYLVGFHRGPHEDIKNTFERMREAAPSILDEGCIIDENAVCIDIIDQFVEADRNNFVTKVMMKIYRQ